MYIFLPQSLTDVMKFSATLSHCAGVRVEREREREGGKENHIIYQGFFMPHVGFRVSNQATEFTDENNLIIDNYLNLRGL